MKPSKEGPFKNLIAKYADTLLKYAKQTIQLSEVGHQLAVDQNKNGSPAEALESTTPADEQRMSQLSGWEEQAKAHWKQHRPKLYADLKASGRLDSRAKTAAQLTHEEYQDGITKGMDPQASWEAVRENHLFLPDEETQPLLGEISDN